VISPSTRATASPASKASESTYTSLQSLLPPLHLLGSSGPLLHLHPSIHHWDEDDKSISPKSNEANNKERQQPSTKAMNTMKIARFPSKGANFEVVEVPIPTPGPGEVRMKVHACGVCHSDMFTKFGSNHTFPRAPGHEAAGVVDAVGEGVKQLKKGDRVGLGWFGGCCQSCENCREGLWNHCPQGKVSGIAFDGGYAEYTVAPEIAFARIPDELSFEEAGPLMCAGVTVFNSMRNQGIHAGETVAVQGVGGLGHLAVQYANKMGFKVVAISSGEDKEKLAKKLGAHVYIDASSSDPAAELKKLGGAKLIVSTSPNSKSIEPLVKGLKVGGKLLILGVPTEKISFNALDLILLNASISGWASGDSRDSESTMKFSALSGVRPQIEVFPLSKVQEAFDRMLENKARFRCVLKMNHDSKF